ncbi:MAG: hypothetical protein ACE14L_14860 [Terriglobales bacterium]
MSVALGWLRTAIAALQEIFDEPAYARFLARQGRIRSGESYAEFLRERMGGRARHRCC